MRVKKIFNLRTSAIVAFLIIAAALPFINCGGSSGGAPAKVNLSILDTTIPLTIVPQITLTAGMPQTWSYRIDLPANFDWGSLAELDIDADAIAASMSVVRTDMGTTPDPTVEFTLRVAAGDDPGACTGGTQALRVGITGNANFSSKSVTTDEGTAPQGAMDIVNSGNFTICASFTSSVDAILTLPGLVASFGIENACAVDPQDVAGTWSGEFYCEDLCGGTLHTTPVSPIELTVIQADGAAIYHDDGGAIYFGSVCGTAFKHVGIGSGYFEWGTFTRTGSSAATKTSTWKSLTEANCGGDCFDDFDTFTPAP